MKPMLFNAEMVCALQDGTKTVTRRAVKPQPEKFAHSPYECCGCRWAFRVGERGCTEQYRPPYHPGDILYVWETWQHGFGGTYLYKASAGCDLFMTPDGKLVSDIPWRPSIHMPREAARIFLRVMSVYPQQLKDATEEDAKAEGFGSRADFVAAILKMYPGSTEESWFWVNEFERISREEALTSEQLD